MEITFLESLQKIYEGLWADPVAKSFIIVILSWLMYIYSFKGEKSLEWRFGQNKF